jgi:hypothetical protein
MMKNSLLMAMMVFVGFWSGGCVSETHKAKLDVWHYAHAEASGGHYGSRERLLQQLGPPDMEVSGDRWCCVVPDDSIRNLVDNMTRPMEARASLASPDAMIMFYDESNRYARPAYPHSFWGMGTGRQLKWFLVQNGRVIGSGAAPALEPPLLYPT